MQDYGLIGLHSMEDRKSNFKTILIIEMFQLIQTLKNSEFPNSQPDKSIEIHARRRLFDDAELEDNITAKKDVKMDQDFESNPRKVTRQSFDSPKRNSFSQPTAKLSAYGMSDSAMAVQPVSKVKDRGDASDRIRVCVRKRPLSKKELARKETDVALVNGRRTIHFYEPKVKVDLTKYVETHEFVFDEVLDSDATNDDVYSRTAQPLVEYIFSGGKATCFAYGQTGRKIYS